MSKHTLAILRLFLGKTQREMASLVGRATPTVQAIELGKLELSPKLATEIVRQTGINRGWLLANWPTAPVDEMGNPYQIHAFERAQEHAKAKESLREVDRIIPEGDETKTKDGTSRDAIALRVLPALVARWNGCLRGADARRSVARDAYKFADTILKESWKEK